MNKKWPRVITTIVILIGWGGIVRGNAPNGGSTQIPEQEQQKAIQALEDFESGLPRSERILLHRLDTSSQVTLSPTQQGHAKKYRQLLESLHYWDRVVSLRGELMGLKHPSQEGDHGGEEASQIAEMALRAADQLRGQYQMIRPAIFQNLLINVGVKGRGLCYQWAGDLLKNLQKLTLKYFRIHWGAAHQGKLREHNCLVITVDEAPFETGLLLDGWRHSGKLYWSLVKKDHYPWKEIPIPELEGL